MATKKSASSSKKTTRKAAPATAKTKTKVTTVKSASTARTTRATTTKFSFSRSPLLAAAIAEFIGTFMLGVVVLTQQAAPLAVLFGLVAIVLGVGIISGAHVNPAVTVGAWVTRRIKSARAVSYIIAQVLGALMALVVVNGFVSAAPEVSAEAAQFGQQSASLYKAAAIPENMGWMILSAELLGALIFGFVFAAVSREKNRLTHAFGIAGGFFLALLVAGQLATIGGVAGAIINPAIAFSMQAVQWQFWPIAVYIVTPLVGVVVGFALQDLVRTEGDVVEV
jgi:aquaporin Z